MWNQTWTTLCTNALFIMKKISLYVSKQLRHASVKIWHLLTDKEVIMAKKILPLGNLHD